MLNVTFAVLVPTRLPDTSSMLTAGCVVQTEASPPPPGCVEKTTCVAGPAAMEKVELRAVVNPVAAALSE